MKKILLVAIAILGLSVATRAQGMIVPLPIKCNKSETILEMLRDTYHEQAVGGGITSGGGHIRLFVSKEKTFTVIVTATNGTSCILTGGDSWTTEEAKPTGHDS